MAQSHGLGRLRPQHWAHLMKSTFAAATLHRSRQALAALKKRRQSPEPTSSAGRPAPEKDLLQRLREAGL